MGFFNWFKRRKQIGRVDGFTDEELDKSKITRLQKAIRQRKIDYLRTRLEELDAMYEERTLENQLRTVERQLEAPFDDGDDDDDDFEDDRDPADDEFDELLDKVERIKKISGGAIPEKQTGTTQKQRSLSDEELKSYKVKLNPMIQRNLKKMSPAERRDFIALHQPDFLTDFDNDTVERAIKLLGE